MEAVQKPKYKKKQSIENNIYSRALITRSISLPIVNIGKNVQQTIERYIIDNFEGKCVVEGFIKVGSCKIITYSSGLVKGTNIGFEVVFECMICCPVEGMLIQCVAKNITKAGIRAESSDETPSPVIVFVTRDHHYMVQYFSTIEEGTKFTARVIGQRFELNDKYVSIIAELVEPKKDYSNVGMNKELSKPKLVIEED
jgi:DNA-directed RNA polymerase subunit E'/Rpb7